MLLMRCKLLCQGGQHVQQQVVCVCKRAVSIAAGLKAKAISLQVCHQQGSPRQLSILSPWERRSRASATGIQKEGAVEAYDKTVTMPYRQPLACQALAIPAHL